MIENSERTIPNTHPSGSLVIREETEAMKTAYENLRLATAQTKVNLEQAKTQWTDFSQQQEQLTTWMDDSHAKLKVEPPQVSELAEKKAQLEKYKVRLNIFWMKRIPIP